MSDRRKHQSRGLALATERLQAREVSRVLDLGSAVGSNVSFFSHYEVQLTIADLRVAIRGDDLGAELDRVLALENALPSYDLVLGWDLFSYMDRAAIEILMSRIARSCRAGTLLFLTASTGAMIPSQPARITMNQRGRLDYQSDVAAQSIANPRFSPTALEGMMPGFRLLHSFLLGDEMQEFLFSYT